MNLSEISIRNPVFAWMLMAALILFGVISFRGMGVSQMPDVDFPVITVSLSWEGAAPEVMETNVADVVEEAAMSIQGVRDISSTSRQGTSSVTIEFELERNIDLALQDVQTKIAQAQRRLPENMDPPVVTKVNPQDQPIMWLGVSSEMPRRELMEYVQNRLKDQFQTISGVGEITLGGYVDRNLRVWIDEKKLAAYNLSAQDVVDAIEKEHVELPAGRIETPTRELNVRAMGEAGSVEEFENIVISRRNGQPVYTPIYIKDVAAVEDGLDDVRRISRIMGKPAVGLGIRKQRGSNEVAVARRVLEKLEEVKKILPKNIDIGVNFDRTRFIEDSIEELMFTLVLSALLTSLVCWLFLGSGQATLNVLLAIPTSIIGAFIFLRFAGFTLNTFTLLGLSLAIGIVVDDAIMVLENIVRYKEKGLDKVEASRVGAKQIGFAATAATIAVIAIFLPVAFMYGIIGKFFFEFGVTISIAVAISLLEALTLTPMRSSQFLKLSERTTAVGTAMNRAFHALARSYTAGLAWALGRRWLVLGMALAVFLGSLAFLPLLRKEFVPSQDQSLFIVRMQTPVGSSLQFTDSRFKIAEQFAMSRPEIARYFGAIGGFGGGEVNTGVLFVTFKPPRQRPIVPPAVHSLSQQELMTLFRKELNKIPDLKAAIQDLSLSGFSAQRGFPVEMTVRGPEWEQLALYSEKIEAQMAASDLMVDVDTDYLADTPEIQVIPDRKKALDRGVSIENIAKVLNALVGGQRVGKYTKGGRRYDIRVRLLPDQRSTSTDIEKLWIWNNRGELVRLRDIVKIEEKKTLLSITRKGRERAISIFANVAPGKSQAQALDEAARIAEQVLPEGYRAVFGGSTQTFKESFQSLLFALWLGVIVSYMVLASQYNSYLHPVTVLMALPFSISGALVSLWIAGQSLNVYSLIGVILLMGIVKKNSIMLVDFTNRLREQGTAPHEALMQACPIRLRPILMTSFATIAGALPPALALGPGAETRIPMAAAVIGGVFVSTLLTLFVVPCAYSLFARIERKKYAVPAHEEPLRVTHSA